jgi:hypothetical protein
MESKLRQSACHGRRLLPVKLNPNPLADNLRQFKQARHLVKEQIQHFFDGQTAIGKSRLKINPLPRCFTRLCGPVLEP